MPPPQRARPQTYFLHRDLSPRVKSLSDLGEEWERQIAKVLLSSDEGTKAEQIRQLLPAQETTATNFDVILGLLTKGIQGRARVLLHHLIPRVKIGDGDVVILPPGDQATAPLIDVLRFFASPKSMRVPVPTGADQLLAFFKHHAFPQSAFGYGRLWPTTSPPPPPPQRKHQWISLPLR